MAVRSLDKDSPWLLVALSALVALGPLTIDMYLPALPGMAGDLDASTGTTQLTISSYLLGFAVFHLACGPLADRYGRRPILIGGMLIYAAAALACAAAATIEQLILFRFVQGVGACVGPTLGRAMARDIFGPRRAARALAHIAMIMALAPAVAPTLGGLLLEFFAWPAIFCALAGYALLAIFMTWQLLPESLPARQSLWPSIIARNYLQLLKSRHYLTTTCASSLLYAGMVCFLSGSSFVFIDMMGVSTRSFGLLFLPTVIGYIGGNAISTRLAHGRESEQVMWIGVQLAIAAAGLMLLAGQLFPVPASIMLPMSLYAAALGVVLPHAMAAALSEYPFIAATASALLGFLQMSISALAGALVGALLSDSVLPMTGMIAVLSLCSWLLIRRLQTH
jgi:DHA1 family bicyclomycin/chloramphenicol resistance-like MFS transporter